MYLKSDANVVNDVVYAGVCKFAMRPKSGHQLHHNPLSFLFQPHLRRSALPVDIPAIMLENEVFVSFVDGAAHAVRQTGWDLAQSIMPLTLQPFHHPACPMAPTMLLELPKPSCRALLCIARLGKTALLHNWLQ